jgi:hypothetical protein
MRKSYTIYCPKCKNFIGVVTPNGVIIGNIIFKTIHFLCGCGEHIFIEECEYEGKRNLLY